MSDFDIRKAINFGWPDNQSRVGETYESLEWFGPGEKPTEAEIIQAWEEWLEQPPPSPYPTEAILRSPDGTPFRITVDDEGAVNTEPVGEQ